MIECRKSNWQPKHCTTALKWQHHGGQQSRNPVLLYKQQFVFQRYQTWSGVCFFVYFHFFSISFYSVSESAGDHLHLSLQAAAHSNQPAHSLSAVADLIVGLIVIPFMGIRFIESCWYFGETFCSLFLFIIFMVVTASLGNLFFISVDRYIAVSDPLRYAVRVTTDKVVFWIIINWLCCAIYSVIILHDTMLYPETQNGCYGDCRVSFKFEHFITDLIVTFVAPSSVIMSIYVKIFCVAKYQAKVVNSVTGVSRSQRKAGKTLGIVVAVFFMCWIPYYIVTLTEGNESTESVELNVTCWILYMNSCMNPLIYALFYKWFRISAKYIVTLKIFKPSSELLSLFPEDK